MRDGTSPFIFRSLWTALLPVLVGKELGKTLEYFKQSFMDVFDVCSEDKHVKGNADSGSQDNEALGGSEELLEH